MSQFKSTLIGLLFLLLALSGCRKASFEIAGSDSLSGLGSANPRTSTERFTSAAGKVDILVVGDNSVSMEAEQANLGNRFSSFTTAIQNLDWQVGVTTTDCSTGPYGICGSLLPLTGASGRILRPSTLNFNQVFLDTILRPETDGCVPRNDCPSGNEEALKAAATAMVKRNTANAGFFRTGAALAIIILTDEDEQSTGPVGATNALDVIDTFTSIWGAQKVLRAYAITTLTGDTACLAAQQAQQGGIGAYGTFSMSLASLTGGVSSSICSANYGPLLTQIGNDVQSTVTDAVTLAHTPIAGSVVLTFTPTSNIAWSVVGNEIRFASSVPAGTTIDVVYTY